MSQSEKGKTFSGRLSTILSERREVFFDPQTRLWRQYDSFGDRTDGQEVSENDILGAQKARRLDECASFELTAVMVS